MARARAEGARQKISVLRIGHRPGRDPRLSTHVALAARALGAERLFLNPPDPSLERRVGEISKRWGGGFEVVGAPEWKAVLRSFPQAVAHLTMYGEPLDELEPKLRGADPLLLVVGGAKVPSEIYRLSTWNLAVGHQPHSEVAALSIVLDRLLGTPGPGGWPGARQVIVPQRRGKKVIAPVAEALP
ncbi:MAG: tRNA (cytidine(56)-2'-O)-methyltransferase [Thermoplasmata archaeon]|nr:tRNA (cytidine(56)-2'-O)-methyltransferase [Thermoplasmata archaeon]